MAGVTPVLAVGMMGTGALNGTRSAAQYIARRRLATDETASVRTELLNSFASGATNLPQALTGSAAGISAVTSYLIRMVNKAYIYDDLKNRFVENSDAMEISPEKMASSAGRETFNKKAPPSKIQQVRRKLTDPMLGGMARVGGKIAGTERGQKILKEGPGSTMLARGALQIAEGVYVVAQGAAIGGGFAAGAGTIYLLSSYLMKKADSQIGAAQKVSALVQKEKQELV